MKKSLPILLCCLLFAFIVSGCDGLFTTGSNSGNTPAEPEAPAIICDSFFWGTWVRMDNGKEYEILESTVQLGDNDYSIISSNETSHTLTVKTLGTFTKQTDSVILNDAIPYFRKGGRNLEYTMKFVGFEDSVSNPDSSRAASGSSLTAIARSKKYSSYVSTADSDENNTFKLIAPSAGDEQKLTIKKGDTTILVLPWIRVENNGDKMGTVPISNAGQYSLKVTGTIPDSAKDSGYLYGNNYKKYPMTIKITNISDVTCNTPAISITADNNLISLESNENLGLIPTSTIMPGMEKTIELTVECGLLLSGYLDTFINVTIENLDSGARWIDCIPLRFYSGLVPITVAAKSTEGNKNAALNGFIIYPDGNNKFFSVPDGGSKTLYVPSFGSQKKYLLSFSGATVTGSLSNSTEMYYTVNPGKETAFAVTIPTNIDDMRLCYNYGEPNNSENSAFNSTEKFTAYLKESDIDFYEINAESERIILPGGANVYTIQYENEKGDAPQVFSIQEGKQLTALELPVLFSTSEYTFGGWYLGQNKIDPGYTVDCNLTLQAKWLEKSSSDLSVITYEESTKTLTFDFSQFNEYTNLKTCLNYERYSGGVLTVYPQEANKEIQTVILKGKYNGNQPVLSELYLRFAGKWTSKPTVILDSIGLTSYNADPIIDSNSDYLIKYNGKNLLSNASNYKATLIHCSKNIEFNAENNSSKIKIVTNYVTDSLNGTTAIEASQVTINGGKFTIKESEGYSSGTVNAQGGNGSNGIIASKTIIKNNAVVTIAGGNGADGTNGTAGKKGDDGNRNTDWSKSGGNGTDGENGTDGSNGGNGGSAIIGNLEVTASTVTLTAGNGGKGGDGGDGGNGGNGGNNSASFGHTGSGGNGGNGGNGGHGGNGGDAISGFLTEGDNCTITLTAGDHGNGGNGGFCGLGGRPGQKEGWGGEGGTNGVSGRLGTNGSPGTDGITHK